MQLNVDPKLQLLRALIPGESVTLREMRERTNMTESTLAESIAALSDVFPELETPPGALKLNASPDLLDPTDFCERLPKRLCTRVAQIDVFAVCESTNTAINMDSIGPNSMSVAIAEYQTGGRGRRGRIWTSGFAAGLCLTVAVRIAKGQAIIPTLTLAIGVQLASVLDAHLSESVLLKWPNDLILANGKLGGILVELSTLAEGDQLLRVGVGINCVAPQTSAMSGDLPALPPAALTDHARHALNRTQIAAELVTGIVDAFDRHSEQGFDVFRSQWQSRDYLKHQLVQVFEDERVRHGTAIGIDQHGALRVTTDEGEIQLMGGEVRVRRR